MSAPRDFLERIRAAEPCSASWQAMQGDERKRFCGDCQLHVYDLSAMTRGEARDLLQNAGGRVCARFRRRADGTVLTRDCGPVRRAVQRRLRRVRIAASAVFGFLAAFALPACGRSPAAGTPDGERPAATADPEAEHPKAKDPKPAPAVDPRAIMGEICVPEEVLGRIRIEPPAPAPKDDGSR